mgnify:FL=1
MRAIERFCHNDEQLYRIVTGRLNRPFYELIEYIRGIQLPSLDYERFERIFTVEQNLIELGRLIGFDMIVNNSDRLPLYWSRQGNVDNIIFPVSEMPADMTWEDLTHHKGAGRLNFGVPCGIDTRPTIIDPNEQLAKRNFERMIDSMRQFLQSMFRYA